MIKSSILFYTNNLRHKNLLQTTIEQAEYLANENSCELIIVSQYPVLKKYEILKVLKFENSLPVFEFSNELTDKIDKNHIIYKNICVLDLNIENKNIRNIVIGQLPYDIKSILIHIREGLRLCSTSKIILLITKQRTTVALACG